MSIIDETNKFTKTIASLDKQSQQHDSKNVICTISAMLRTLSVAIPPNVPILVKSLIIMAATILEGICELLPDSQKN